MSSDKNDGNGQGDRRESSEEDPQRSRHAPYDIRRFLRRRTGTGGRPRPARGAQREAPPIGFEEQRRTTREEVRAEPPVLGQLGPSASAVFQGPWVSDAPATESPPVVGATRTLQEILDQLPDPISAVPEQRPPLRGDSDLLQELLLRRFKLSAETFRLRFVQHQKRMESSWRDLAFELRSFLEEWLDGVNVKDFESLKDFMVVDQIKRRVGNEVREHFVDTWTKISSSSKLADLLDDYDGVRRSSKTGHIPGNDRKRTNGNFEKKNPVVHDKNAMNTDYKRPNSPRNWKQERSDRRQCFECGSSQHLRAQCPKLAKMKNFSRINRVTRRLVETTSEKSGSQRFPENVAENQTDEGTILTTQLKAPEKEITRISPLQKIPVKIEDNTFEGIVDTGAEITVIRQDIIDSCSKQGEGSIKIISAFGEEELAPLVTINVKINDGKHGNVPVTCAASKKLISDMLISSTTYEALCKKIEAHTLLPVINNVDSEQPVHEEPNQEDNEESPLEEKICFSKLQKDDSLKTAWAFGNSQQNGYSVEDGILLHSEWENLGKAHGIAMENAEKNQAEYARRYNLRAREKTFQVGEKVLILDSASSHKLLKKWIGPVSIVAFTRPHSVLVKMEDEDPSLGNRGFILEAQIPGCPRHNSNAANHWNFDTLDTESEQMTSHVETFGAESDQRQTSEMHESTFLYATMDGATRAAARQARINIRRCLEIEEEPEVRERLDIPRATFRRIIREMLGELNAELRIENDAIELMQYAGEDHIGQHFASASSLALQAGRVTVRREDFDLLASLQDAMGGRR
ncbi:hypothetical protein HNY73_017406 [Argiope bruennichi]|uniref:CCHC-type domain-containing protein n=1 Tax=Argiope bruennichi TaxID=94029 RepID=A0A8T0EAJ9_ARGBR|nr:hypothetical protein HNY73_017406 [Argiope bruennichi]